MRIFGTVFNKLFFGIIQMNSVHQLIPDIYCGYELCGEILQFKRRTNSKNTLNIFNPGRQIKRKTSTVGKSSDYNAFTKAVYYGIPVIN